MPIVNVKDHNEAIEIINARWDVNLQNKLFKLFSVILA